MRRQAFGFCKPQGSRRQHSQPVRAGALNAHALQEVIQSESGRKPRCAAGGQHVVRAGHIVTQRFRRVVAKENVTVPAGQFTAYRIEATGFNLDTGGTIRRVLWVVPGINANVALEVEVRRRDNSLEQTYRWELASYSGRRQSQSPVRPA